MEYRTEIAINNVTKETEKAICVNVTVNWGEGGWKQKDIWFPKSTCEVIEVNGEPHILVADWMVAKTCAANAFKGYRMNFPLSFTHRFAFSN